MLSPNAAERLEILRRAQPERPWNSCSDRRRCIVCERVFSGTEVLIFRKPREGQTVACPGCRSAPELWVRLGDPLTDAAAWSDWECAMQSWTSRHERDGDPPRLLVAS